MTVPAPLPKRYISRFMLHGENVKVSHDCDIACISTIVYCRKHKTQHYDFFDCDKAQVKMMCLSKKVKK